MAYRSVRAAARTTVVMLVVTALALALTGAVTMAGSTTVALAQPGTGVEDEGANCPVSVPGSFPANSRLPDPFTSLDGTRISTVSDWRCRRAEIRELAERFVYGDKPTRPASVTGTVSNTSVTVNVTDNGRSSTFSASVQLPNGSGPFPAVVVLGGFGADTAAIRAAGAAVISYDPYVVGREGTPRNNKQGAFYSIYGSSSSTGLLMAWAWGVSRIIDVIEQSGGTILRAGSTGVTGCSRFGKGAFVAGAFDQRIALTMPIESGTGGVPIFRGIPGEAGSQPLSSAYGEEPWLGDAFGSYTGNPNQLPVDTHELVAMVAPRGLFIMENPHVDWLGARSGSVAALAGAEVYRALGALDSITYWSDVQDGTHCASRSEWRTALQQNIQEFLLDTGNAPGGMRIASSKAGDLSQWRDWQTPTLTSGPTSPPPTPPSPPGTPPPPPTSPPPTPPTPPPAGACTASYELVSQWSGGFQAGVTVQAGSVPLNGWTVSWTFTNGAQVTQIWNGTIDSNGPNVRVSNASYNGTVSAGATTSFGFLGNGSGNPAPATLTCTSP